MTDAQFQELLRHIDRIDSDIFLGVFYLAIVLWVVVFIHGITHK
jgi:hypothetical protein